MAEYIDREAAKAELCERCMNIVLCTRSDNDCPIKRGLNAIHAADVKPVVLCRDCIHYTNRYWDSGKCYGTFCDLWNRDFGKDAYCYRGKRRKNEDGHE